MSKRIFIMLMALAVLNGCVYDKYAPDHCPQEGKTYYMSFVLSPGGEPDTKALPGSFEQAELSEQLVSSIDLYFYTGGGTFQGKEHVTEFRQKPSGSSGDNVANVVYDFVVGLNFRPYRLLLVINHPTLDLSNLSLQDARTKLLEGTEKGYAGSSTSVTYRDASDAEHTLSVTPMFMGSSAYLNAAGVAICDNLIPGEYVWDNKPDALARPMHVYVERMAAKVTLKTAKKSFEVPVVTSQDNVTAKVDIEGWFLNGVNKESYVFKQISESWHWSTWEWTNPTRYRSHWARDNSYGGGENQPTPFTQQRTSSVPAGEKLCFYYADHTPQQLLWSDAENKYVGSDYCLENTADENALPVADDSAASLYSRITHVIVMARLRFKLGYGAVDDPAGYTAASPDIFRYKGVFYTKKTLLAALRQDAGLDPTIKDSDLEMVSAAGQSWCPEYENGERVAVKRTDTDEVLSLTEISGEQAHIDGFAQGRFYYKIPVEHFNNGPVSSAYYPAGRYGVVRNHQYEITLNDLTGIGTGIWDIDWDIRPYRKPDDYIVSAYMKVSPWKQLETRFLFVDPSGMLITDGQRVHDWNDNWTQWQ